MSQSAPGSNLLANVPNPFTRDVVGSPLDDPRWDVPRINAEAKKRCRELIERVSTRKESGSLLLYGDPGTGKTHLLSRLRHQLDLESDAGRPTLFIPLRMQTSPTMIWRFVRFQLADALLRKPFPTQPIQLERLLGSRRHDVESMYNRDLGMVLENLLEGRHFRDCAAWLRGHELPESALQAIGVFTQPVDEELQEERSYQLIRDLAILAEPVPFVFCLDQVEALQRHQDDKEGIFALGKLVATLHDTLHNAAIICCVQTSFIDAIQSSVRGSEQDRLLVNRAALYPLAWEQAMEVIMARLESEPAIRETRPRDAARTWPLDVARLKPVFEPGGACVARRVLHRARELFDEVAGGSVAPPESLEAMLSRLYQERLESRPPTESDFILRDALPMIFEVMGMQPKGPGQPRAGGFDLVVEHDGRPAAFALCNQRPGVGLVNRFRKIGENWDSTFTPRLVLLRDARLGIASTAKASQQRLDELRRRRAELVNVAPEALAALDSLRSLLVDASSGDLVHKGEAVPRKTVADWIAAHPPPPLADLLDQLTGQVPRASQVFPALTAFLQERKMVSVEEAARELRVPVKEVADCAYQNPQQFGVIGGHSPVLFQPIGPINAV